MAQVVIGMLGTSLDRRWGPRRWSQWRPTVSLFRHHDLPIARLELIYGAADQNLADQIADDVRLVSPATEVRLHTMEFDDPWDFQEVYGNLHDFATRYPFDLDRESYLFHITTGTHVVQICTFLLTETRHFPGRLVQTAPAKTSDQINPGRYAIIDLDLSKYDRIAQRFASEQRTSTEFLKAGIKTRNAAFNRMISEIEHVAAHSKAPMLLTGPTGAGKSSLARRIFELKKQRRQVSGRFVEVNCATIRGDAAMSTLFGHKRGAFTGAAAERAGLLREADKGALFLDEIGELGLDEQAMLLRAIEEKRFFPLGADREVESEFQLICGTNRDLAEAVRERTFREDLLARICLWSFDLPGLAARREDIEPNVQYELAQLTAATGLTYRFNREALERFLQFARADDSAWNGNFRDLNAAIARMATMAPSGRITTEVVDGEIERLRRGWRAAAGAGSAGFGPVDALSWRAGSVGFNSPRGAAGIASPTQFGDMTHDDLNALLGDRAARLDEFDRVQLAHVVAVCRTSPTLSAAGRRLFAASRARRKSTNDADRLRKYLDRFGLSWEIISSG